MVTLAVPHNYHCSLKLLLDIAGTRSADCGPDDAVQMALRLHHLELPTLQVCNLACMLGAILGDPL